MALPSSSSDQPIPAAPWASPVSGRAASIAPADTGHDQPSSLLIAAATVRRPSRIARSRNAGRSSWTARARSGEIAPVPPERSIDYHVAIRRPAEALQHRDGLRLQIGALQRPADQRRGVCDADVPGIEPGPCLRRDRVEPVQGMSDPGERRVPPSTVPGSPAGLGQEEGHARAAAVQIGAEGTIGEVHLVRTVFRVLGHAHPGTAVAVTEGGVAQVVRDAGSNRQRRVRIEDHRGPPSSGGKSSREPGFR